MISPQETLADVRAFIGNHLDEFETLLACHDNDDDDDAAAAASSFVFQYEDPDDGVTRILKSMEQDCLALEFVGKQLTPIVVVGATSRRRPFHDNDNHDMPPLLKTPCKREHDNDNDDNPLGANIKREESPDSGERNAKAPRLSTSMTSRSQEEPSVPTDEHGTGSAPGVEMERGSMGNNRTIEAADAEETNKESNKKQQTTTDETTTDDTPAARASREMRATQRSLRRAPGASIVINGTAAATATVTVTACPETPKESELSSPETEIQPLPTIGQPTAIATTSTGTTNPAIPTTSHPTTTYPYADRYLLSRGTHGVGRLGGGTMKPDPHPKPWYHHIWDAHQQL